MPVQSIILLAKTKLLLKDDFPFLSKDTVILDSNADWSLKLLLTRGNRLGKILDLNKSHIEFCCDKYICTQYVLYY